MVAYAFLNGTGSYFIKIGLNKVRGLEISLWGVFRNVFRTFYQLIKTPLFIFGFILTVIGFLIYQYALSLYDLSLVKPLQTLSILFILFWGLKYLKEHIKFRELLGILVFIVGCILLSFYISANKPKELNLNNLIIFSVFSIILSAIFLSYTIIKKDEKVKEYFLSIASGLFYSLGMVFNNALYVGFSTLSLQLFFNPYLYFMVISYFFAAFILLVAYFKGRLSIAASIIGFLTFGIPVFGGLFIFNENISFFKIIGLIFIFCGFLILYPRIRLLEKNSINKSP